MNKGSEKRASFVLESKRKKTDFDYEKTKNEQLPERKKSVKNLDFEKTARYRCDQINLTKVQKNITFSSDIKTQYLLSTAKSGIKYFHVKLEDYIYSIDPKAMEIAFQVVEPIEYIRNNIEFSQNKNAEIADILNLNQINQDWKKFRDHELTSLELYQKLKQQNATAAEDIIKAGNQEFVSKEEVKDTLYKNLFYHVLLKTNLGKELQNFTFTQDSQLFPRQKLVTKVVKSKVSEDASTSVFRLVGTLDKSNISDEVLRKQYDEIYKPMIKFSFTEFDYIYRTTYTLDSKTGLLLDAVVSLSERIKNNFESITKFQIKKVEL